MMILDDRATDGKPDSHAVSFRRVESLEESICSVRAETDPRILDGQVCTIAFSCGSDQQLSRTIVDSAHRVRSVTYQVQDHLLKLHTIACDNRKAVDKFRPQKHPLSLKFIQQQGNHFSCGLIQVHRFCGCILLAEECA